MLDLSDPLSAVNLTDYFKNEYSLASNSYFSEDGKVKGYWAGKLAPDLGLRGLVTEEQFSRLADGRHPITNEQLIEHRKNQPKAGWMKDDGAWRQRLEEKFLTALERDSKLFAPARAYQSAKQEKQLKVAIPAPEYGERQKTLLEMHEIAARLFERNLAADGAARDYLAGRQITPEAAAEFRLGVSGSSGRDLVDALRSYGPELMRESGLFVETGSGEFRDRFRERVMFPIQDTAGNVIAFAGRKLSEEAFGPKYLNSPGTQLYNKSATLYNFHRVKDAARVVTVEGYTDVIAAHMAGVKAVATAGTAFTPEHAEALAGRAITINTDADEAGQKAARRQVEALLEKGIVPTVATLKRKDAAEVLEHDGAKAYRKQIKDAAPVLEWLAATIREQHPGTDAYAKVDAMHEVLAVLAKTAPEQRAEIDRQLTEHLGLDVEQQPGQHREHRAGWDFTFHAPKSISATAIVGGDERVREAHRRAVNRTLEYIERWVQARMGGNAWPKTTGKWSVAVFEHDTARPVNGYAAPHLHSHSIVFNLTMDENGQARSLQTHEFYRIQKMVTWVYRAELAHGLRQLGYELERGSGGAPEIAGYSPEYMAAESGRSILIRERLEQLGISGPRAAAIVAHQDCEEKLKLTPEELKALHKAHAEQFGNQPEQVVQAAKEKARQTEVDPALGDANKAVTFSRRHLAEREAVFEHSRLVENALRYGFGAYRVDDVEREIQRRVEAGELVKIDHVRPYAPGARYATARMVQLEREVIQSAVAGKDAVQPIVEHAEFGAYPMLADNPRRQQVLRGILATRDQTVILQGSAGTGKSTSLRILSEIAQEHGYQVVGLAPTGVAADNLDEIGVKTETLQKFLTGRQARSADNNQARFYFVDEGSLASTSQIHKFYERLRPDDRVLLIGDDSPKRTVGQHTSVEAGRAFQQLQEAGIKTAQLNKILRQKEPWLLEVVQHFRAGRVKEAVKILDEKGKIEEYKTSQLRYARIAMVYAQQPERTLVIAPDNETRREIDHAIRSTLKQKGLIADEKDASVLVSRDFTRADRTLAENYRIFDTVRYLSGSAEHGIQARDYATVIDIDKTRNLLTVLTADQRRVTYDPRNALANASVYEDRQLTFGIGDRIQATAPFKEKGVRTRQTGTIKEFDGQEITVEWDNGKTARWRLDQFRHVDFGYVMTSHSAQSLTVDRALVYVETGDSRLRKLHNQTFAYVAGSRPEFELRIFTDDADQLLKALSREQEKHKALSPEQIVELAKTA